MDEVRDYAAEADSFVIQMLEESLEIAEALQRRYRDKAHAEQVASAKAALARYRKDAENG